MPLECYPLTSALSLENGEERRVWAIAEKASYPAVQERV
jgi:hypothetical protein